MPKLKKEKIIILGATGFFGRNLIEELDKKGFRNRCDLSSKDINLLRDEIDPSLLNFLGFTDSIIINLAAHCGGIGYNQANQLELYQDNLKIIGNVYNICHRYKAKTLINLGSVCSYPYIPGSLPFKEQDIWNGYPEPTNAPYGIAKRSIFLYGNLYKERYNLSSINPVMANMYGPHDHFDSAKGHVIPDLIVKFSKAIKDKSNRVSLWGSGKATRDFLYIKDAVKILIKLIQSGHDDPSPINVGTGRENSIAMASYYIAKKLDFKGEILWDESKPDGQPRRCLDIKKLKEIIKDHKFVPITQAVSETVDWYLKEKK